MIFQEKVSVYLVMEVWWLLELLKMMALIKVMSVQAGDTYLDFMGKWKHSTVTLDQAKYPVAIFRDVDKPTTLADLVGEDGQKVVWLHWESNGCDNDTAAAQVLVTKNNGGILVDSESIKCMVSKNYRWSHSPFTAFEDANKFRV